MLKLINKSFILITLVGAALLFINSCKESGSKKIGAEVPSDLQPVKLSTILENPSQYNGKKVVVKGVITLHSASRKAPFFRFYFVGHLV